MKGKNVVRGVSALGFAAIAIVAVGIGWKNAETGSRANESVPMAAVIESAPESARSVPKNEEKSKSLQDDEHAISNATGQQRLVPQSNTRGLSFKSAQTHSNKCRVPDGSICYVPAQQVGSSCTCPGNQSGLIVP